MYTKDQVLTKLNELLTYSIEQEPDFESQFSSLMQPIFNAVNSYFDADRSALKKPLNDLGLYLHNELWQRGAVWEGGFDMGLGSNPPETYNDLRKMFYQFDWMTTNKEDFYNSWVWGVPTPPEGSEGTTTTEPEPLSHPMVSAWASEVSQAQSNELPAINALADWLEDSMAQSGSVSLWEDTGALLSAPETSDLAQTIFVDRGLLEAAKILNLQIYIPTYLRD